MGHFISVADAAQRLNISSKTLYRWCASGKIPAIPKQYGSKTTFLISPQTVELAHLQHKELVTPKKQAKAPVEPHKLLSLWEKAMAQGIIGGRSFSPKTIKIYRYYAGQFFERYTVLSVDTLRLELMRIPAKHFCKRLKLYEALICFGRFLAVEGNMDSSFFTGCKPLRPKRHVPPKRLTVGQDNLGKLLEASTSPQDRLIVMLLSSTGIRASEACALKWEDIDTEKGILTVRLAKGGKTRQVGLNTETLACLFKHLDSLDGAPLSGFVFRDKYGKSMQRHGLYQRLERLGKKVGVPVSPHALRRAFVTINANKGRPLQMLQIACGHSSITTTRSYCMTVEQEVIEAMKGW